MFALVAEPLCCLCAVTSGMFCTRRQTRPSHRLAPRMAAASHSRSCSGGAWLNENNGKRNRHRVRQVSHDQPHGGKRSKDETWVQKLRETRQEPPLRLTTGIMPSSHEHTPLLPHETNFPHFTLKSTNVRAASAPCSRTMSSGATPLCLDFDIFSHDTTVGCPVARSIAAAAPFCTAGCSSISFGLR